MHDASRARGASAARLSRWPTADLEGLLGGSARLLVDRSARIEFANAEARELLSLSSARSTLIEIVVPDALPRLLRRLAEPADVRWHDTVEVRGVAGERFPVELRAVGALDGLWVVEATCPDENALEVLLLEVASELLEAEELGDRAVADDLVRRSVGRVADGLGADRASVFVFDTADPMSSFRSFLWARDGAEHPGVPAKWWLSRLGESGGLGKHTGTRVVLRVDDASTDDEADLWRHVKVASTVAVQSSIGGGWDVTVGMSTKDTPHHWSDREVRVLQLAAAIYGNAIRRSQADAAARAHRAALEASEARWRSTIMDAPAIVFRIDRATTVLLANAEAARYGEVPAELLIGHRLKDFVSDEMARSLERDVEHVFATGEGVDSVICLPTPAHGDVWLDCRGVPERGPDGGVESMLLFAIDVTERRAMEEQIRRSADIDPLTGLANRRAALDRLAELLNGSEAPEPVAVLFIDLDRFKHTNDALGHAAGDAVLQAVARALGRSAEEGDIIARLGGDEFAIVLPGSRHLVDLVRRVERVRRAIAEPIDLGGQTVVVTASIGVAVASPGDRASADLLRLADVAMYQAKTRGRNRFEIFDENLRTEVDERVGTEAALRKAVPDRQLEVHYQPEVRLDDGTLVGLEALVRWRHPERGLLPAVSFIGIAEESTLISDIGRFVLSEACRQVGDWTRRYPDLPLILRVNVSGRQLVHASLLRDVTIALAEANLPPDRLCLEITETALMTDIDTTIQMLRWIRDLGVRLAVDDFGTGYSSLGYLERFPVDTLKIDRSFVVGLGEDPKSSAIVRTLVSLAQVLDLDVVAEGVETPEQAALLQTLGCAHAQGYLYAPALTGSEIEPLLEAGRLTPRLE